MERYVCIHGHFYQPPRDNAWLESIELQDLAYPYHDWNERTTAECYEPNMLSRILDEQRRIVQMVNNYARISFNFGPTLLSWMETNCREVYDAILAADGESQQTFSGHGSALAQAYNHMILPLANRRDKYTQVMWGIRDFEHRFGRKPEGMWLPETAVDLETLEVLAEMDIRFTILAPHQARRVRPSGSSDWQDLDEGTIDPALAYLVRLPSGRTLSLFFYDGGISREVAFEGLLNSGEAFARRLHSAFSDDDNGPQLVHIATDGETYGHHHRFGDMALAYALHYIESQSLAKITNYGEYLERHPPTHEVDIIENSSWSCVHGIERWRSDCGCNSGGRPRWNQAWRAPLRRALDWLRDTLAPGYEQSAKGLLKDPWRARNDYIEVVLDRSPDDVDAFLARHALRVLNEDERVTALKLLEVQRQAMLMYTSCGWFFDELSGIETVQVIQYAGRALQLAQEVFDDTIEPRFLDLLEQAKSNIRRHGDGRQVYEKFVKPAMVDLTAVAAHYAVSSLFEEYGEETKTFCYQVNVEDYRVAETGKQRLAIGRGRVTSEITRESADLSFGVIHFGDHNLNAGVREFRGEEAYQNMVHEVTESFSTMEFAQVIRLLDKHFGTSSYSLRALFRDEQRKVVDRILESTLAEIESAYRDVYERHYAAMRFLAGLNYPVPKAFHSAAESILNIDLRRALGTEVLDVDGIRNQLEQAGFWDVELDVEGLSYVSKQTLEGMMAGFVSDSENVALLDNLSMALDLTGAAPFEVNLWRVQNLYYSMLQTVYPEVETMAKYGDQQAEDWVARFTRLGEQLSIQVT